MLTNDKQNIDKFTIDHDFLIMFHSCPVIDVPVDAGGDGVVATETAKTLLHTTDSSNTSNTKR